MPDCFASIQQHVTVPEPFSWTVIKDQEHRLGLAGAVRAAWDWARDRGVDYLLHVEEDFRFTVPVDVTDLVRVLEADLWLAQVVLKRQPWSPEEHASGGIIECHPEDYSDAKDGDLRWVSHQRIFSLNPCLIPRRVFELGWPDGNEAEMTTRLVNLGYRFAFFGERDDPPRVEHVGYERAAGWRL